MTIHFQKILGSTQINPLQDKTFATKNRDELYMEAIRDKDIQKLKNLIFQETDLNRKVKLSFSSQIELKIWASYKEKEFLRTFYQTLLENYNPKTSPTEVEIVKECLAEDKPLRLS